jgi:hypothetical protein
MMTAGQRAVAGLNKDASSVSFDDMGADLHALYSVGSFTLDTLAVDLRALYGNTPLPMSQSNLLAELRELYGDDEIAWPDFSKDFEGLYTNHVV